MLRGHWLAFLLCDQEIEVLHEGVLIGVAQTNGVAAVGKADDGEAVDGNTAHGEASDTDTNSNVADDDRDDKPDLWGRYGEL